MESFFLKLLRCGAMGEELAAADLPKCVDWKAVMAMAEKQSATCVIADAIAMLPPDLQPPLATMQRLRSRVAMNFAVYYEHSQAMASLAQTLGARGIGCVLLKGIGVAQRYPKPELRGCGDIDLYVGKANFARALEALQQDLGVEIGGENYNEKHLDFKLGKVPVELHRRATLFGAPWVSRRWQRYEEAELCDESRLRHCSLAGAEVCVPSAEFDAIYLFLHAWKHLTNRGIGMRHLCDWGLQMRQHHKELDAEQLRKRLKQLGLLRQWSILASVVIEKLGVTPQEMVVYNRRMQRLGRKAYGIIREGGNFGNYSEMAAKYSKAKSKLGRKLVSLRWIAAHAWLLARLDPVEATFGYINRTRMALIDLFGKKV